MDGQEEHTNRRNRKRQAEVAAERERARQIQIQHHRREWRDTWLAYALNSTPWRTPKEAENQIYAAVELALSRLDPDQPASLVKRLIGAAVQEALAPWRRAEKKEDALKSGLEQIPWAVKYNQEFADLRQRARSLVAESVDRLRPDATDWEVNESAKQAVEPVIREYEHRKSCQKLLSFISLPGATPEEFEDAREAVKMALSTLRIGSTQREMKKARDTALAPFQTMIAERDEHQRKRTERNLRRFTAELTSSAYLDRIRIYLNEVFEFDGGHPELIRTAERLREPVRRRIIKTLVDNPNMTPAENEDASRH